MRIDAAARQFKLGTITIVEDPYLAGGHRRAVAIETICIPNEPDAWGRWPDPDEVGEERQSIVAKFYTFEEAVSWARAYDAECPTCSGHGAERGRSEFCSQCRGLGMVETGHEETWVNR